MAKKHLMIEAERLYVEYGLSFENIASRLDVSEKTVRNWAKAGGWQAKRKEYLESEKKMTSDDLRIKIAELSKREKSQSYFQ